MDIKLLFGIASWMCVLYGFVIYIHSILKGETKPHLYTRILYLWITGVVFAWQLKSNAWYALIFSGFNVFYCFLSLFLTCKYGTKDIIFFDAVLLFFWFISLLLWYFLWNPLYSVILMTLIDLFATIPTVRKTYNDPYSENLGVYIIGLFSILFSILAVKEYSMINLFYLVFLVPIELSYIIVIIRGRKLLSQ